MQCQGTMEHSCQISMFYTASQKNAKLIKQQIYTKTEARELYSKVFQILLRNVIKIGPYNFEVYRFKVCKFF